MKRREFFAGVSAILGGLVFGRRRSTACESTVETNHTSVAFDIETQPLIKSDRLRPVHPHVTFTLPTNYDQWPPHAIGR